MQRGNKEINPRAGHFGSQRAWSSWRGEKKELGTPWEQRSRGKGELRRGCCEFGANPGLGICSCSFHPPQDGPATSAQMWPRFSSSYLDFLTQNAREKNPSAAFGTLISRTGRGRCFAYYKIFQVLISIVLCTELELWLRGLEGVNQELLPVVVLWSKP